MPKLPVKLIAALALAGVSLGDLSSAPAQSDAGEALISDSPREPITESEPLPIPGDASNGGMLAGLPGYPSGYGPGGYGLGGYGGMGYPDMPPGGSPIQHGKWYGYASPGPEWNRPIRRPLYRVPVTYARYWPTSYYTGVYDPRAIYSQPLPMVYMPTDTTQLGFTHQRVPQWLPRPNAIPGPPWPPQWHHVMPVGGYGEGGLGYDAYGYGGYPSAGYGATGTYGEYCPPGSVSDSNSTTPPAVINPESTPMETGQPAPIAPGPAPPTE
jgi:hypothetical protein